MKRIIVIGCPGSGKSTFSRTLQKLTGIPLYHLDLLNFNSDKTTVPREILLERLNDILSRDKWIIDGNYASTMELRISFCDTIFFLDYPAEVCLDGIEKRKGKPRPDMPWIETEDDAELLEFIKNYTLKSRPTVISLLEKNKDKRIIVFKDRTDADKYLDYAENRL